MRNPKKQHAEALRKHHVLAAKTGSMLKDPPPVTWSARMPAYVGTVLCPDQRYRIKKK